MSSPQIKSKEKTERLAKLNKIAAKTIKLFTNVNDKTKYRGLIHKMAFIIACFVTIASIITMCILKYFEWYVILYCSVQMLQFGCSALYHLYDGNAEVKKVLRNFDHAAIFFLISGTQTSIVQMLPKRIENVKTTTFLLITWVLCVIGNLRVFLLKNLDMYSIIDLVVYCGQGLSILLFKHIFLSFYTLDLVFIVAGGVFYITGAVIYGVEKPNPIPKVFGFHEIFHVCTLLGNGCFGLTIFKAYFLNLQKYHNGLLKI